MMKRTIKGTLFLLLGVIFLGNGVIDVAAKDYPDAPKSIPLTGIFQVPQGANSYIDGNNVVITDKTNDQVGSIFSTENNRIYLEEDFESEMYVYLDGSADGIAFTMHNDPDALLSFEKNTGGALGIYSKSLSGSNLDGKQLKRSFAVEFDTYYNADNFDAGLHKHDDWGHVAHTFPDDYQQYWLGKNGGLGVKHNDVQYPPFKLGDGQWRLFKMDWKTWDETDVGHLTYQFGDLEPVTVRIGRYDLFNSENVYWGFTGSTGAINEKGVIAFKSVPGLVNYSDNVIFKDQSETNITETEQESEITVNYIGEYLGGKQNLLEPVYDFLIPENVEYMEDSVEVDGVPTSAIYKNKKLQVTVPNNLSLSKPNVNITFKVKDTGVTKDTKVLIKTELNAQNLIKDREDSYDIKYNPSITSITGGKDDKTGLIKAEVTHTIAKQASYKDVLLDINVSHLAKGLTASNTEFSLTDLVGKSYDVSNLNPEFRELANGDKVARIKISKELSEEIIKNNGDKDSGVLINTSAPFDFNTSELIKYFDINTKYFSVPVSVERVDKPKNTTSTALVKMIAPTGKAVSQTVVKGSKVGDLKLVDLVKELTTIIPNSSVEIIGFKESVESIFDTVGETEITVIIKETFGGMTTEIKVPITVIELADKVVTINFVNEDGELFPNTSLVFYAKEGEKLDISKEANTPESLQVEEVISNLEKEGYKLTKRPDSEQIIFTKDPQTVAYEFKGTIGFVSVPNAIDFGKIEYSAKTYRVDNPMIDGNLIVKATSTEKFSVAATVEKVLTNKNSTLPNALRYVKEIDEDELVLNEEAQEVYNNFEGKVGVFDISKDWGETTNSKGLKLQLNSNDEVEDGSYTGTIVWSIIPKVDI